MAKRFFLLVVVAIGSIWAHPMGNFTVSHYAKFQVGAKGADLTYALDLAELPTTNLLQQWGLDRNSPQPELDRRANEQAREWASHLEITSGGKSVPVHFVNSSLVIADGAGNLPILRITSHLRLDLPPGRLLYEDHNYPERAGWKEIVIVPAKGAAIERASQGGEDHSKALSEYPQDPTVAPPQDLRASIEWTASRPAAPSNCSDSPTESHPHPRSCHDDAQSRSCRRCCQRRLHFADAA